MVDAYAEYDNCEGSGFQDDPSLPLESDIGVVSTFLFHTDFP